MDAWLRNVLGLRLKRSIGFGLMLGVAGGLFWYVLSLSRGAEEPFTGALLFGTILLVVSSALAYTVLFRRVGR